MKHFRRLPRPRAAALLGLAALALSAAAPSVLHAQTFTKIIQYDSVNNGAGSTVPGHAAPLINFADPAISNGQITFTGLDSLLQRGVYTTKASPIALSGVANTESNVPAASGGTGFQYAASAVIQNGNYVFAGRPNQGSSTQTATGIYTGAVGTNAAFTPLADTNLQAPGQTVNFIQFATPSISGTTVVFNGRDNNANRGIYTGTVGVYGATRIADYNTVPAPKGGNFTNLTSPAQIKGSAVVFSATTNGTVTTGLFRGTVGSSTLTTLADTTTAAPGTGSNFTNVSLSTNSTFTNTVAPALNNTQVAFQASYSGGTGLFRVGLDGTALTSLGVNTTTVAPRTGAAFTAFTGLSLNNNANALAFTANYGTNSGLFLQVGGTLTTLLLSGDTFTGVNGTIDASTTGLRIVPGSFDGSQIAFFFSTSGGQGIGVVDVSAFLPAAVPEPSTWALLAAGAGLTGLALRRRARLA